MQRRTNTCKNSLRFVIRADIPVRRRESTNVNTIFESSAPYYFVATVGFR